MEIHNITEDIVLDSVNEIFDTIEREGKTDRPCTCPQCRLDVACYVLNRTVPRYVVSSRGVAYNENEELERQQEEADIVTMIHDGLKRVASAKRPHFEHDPRLKHDARHSGPVFNIPTIIGRLFNGQNFEPLSGVTITLYKNAQMAGMIGPAWQNPYTLVANNSGTFSFWPSPEACKKEGTSKAFDFELVAELDGYEPLRHFFRMDLVSEQSSVGSFSMQRTVKLPDLYMFEPDEDTYTD